MSCCKKRGFVRCQRHHDHLTALKMQWGLLQKGEKASLGMFGFGRQVSCLHLGDQRAYGDIVHPDREEHVNNKCRARTCRRARQLWYGTATSHITANISMYQLYLALVLTLVCLFVY